MMYGKYLLLILEKSLELVLGCSCVGLSEVDVTKILKSFS